MNIPKLPGSKRLFLPILEAMSRGEDLHASQLVEPIRQHFNLSEEEVSSTRAGSSKPLIYEKLTGTIMHLVKAGLLDRTRRGYTRISPLGLKLLSTKPEQVNYTTLREFCDYNPNKSKGKPARRGTKGAPAPMPAVATEAAVDRAVSQLNNALVVALANEVRQASATDLSHIVCELLERLGYGSVQTDPRANGSSGGTVLTDPLGLNHAYVKTAAGEKPDLRDLQIFCQRYRDHPDGCRGICFREGIYQSGHRIRYGLSQADGTAGQRRAGAPYGSAQYRCSGTRFSHRQET